MKNPNDKAAHDLMVRQVQLCAMVADVAERYLRAHNRRPGWIMASPGWFDQMDLAKLAAANVNYLTVVCGVPVMCHTMLEGVSVMAVWRG